jgi:hypothetical protein
VLFSLAVLLSHGCSLDMTLDWEPVLTDLFSGLPAVADAAARGPQAIPMSAVSVVAGVACPDAVQLRRAALGR